MIYRLLLSSMTIFTLATCQNQNVKKAEKTTTSENNPVVKTTSTTPKKSEPKMSTGMPPDAEAVKVAKQEAANPNQSNLVYLKEGENIYVKEYKMNVTFKGMVEDSRCPKDVQCIWAGNATAEVEFMGVATRPRVYQFSTTIDAKKGHFTKQNFNGYEISLVSVTPETTSAKGFKALKGSYKIALKFEKENPDKPTSPSGGPATK